MVIMNNYSWFWRDRYDRLGGKRTVGAAGWSESYYEELRLQFEPVAHDILARHMHHRRAALDFGCGIGRWRPLLKRNVANYYATDIVDRLVPEPDDQFQLIEDHHIPFCDAKFDLIFTCVVLQHVTDETLLHHYLEQFRTRLQASGILMLTENTTTGIPNHIWLVYRSPYQYLQLLQRHGFAAQWVHTHIFDGEEHGIFIAKT
jgi:SAM-dependent methyltransferase